MLRSTSVVWVGDIKTIKTKIGWVYFTIVIDLYNHAVIDNPTNQSIDIELVERALGETGGRHPETKGTIFHSDRGSQYASSGY